MRKIKAVVFDFGNVIININPENTLEAFSELTFKSTSKIKQLFEENSIYQKFETGFLTEGEFRDSVRQTLSYPLNDNEIDKAWNALLLDVPFERIEYLRNLSLEYPIYLLSNTNSIHIKKCLQIFKSQHGIPDFRKIFKEVFLSYQMGLWKPDYKIYHHVIGNLQLKPEEILFLDDNTDNIAAASDLGIKTVKINPPESFTAVLKTLL